MTGCDGAERFCFRVVSGNLITWRCLMAVVRTRSTPPYGLFAAVALAVLMTGAAVVFYLMWAKSTEELKSANDAVTKAGTAMDVNGYKGLNAAADTRKEGPSYLSQANKQIAALQGELR